jgi:glutamate dehydrogenase
VPAYIRLIEMLEERGELDRKTEGLAEDEELARRSAEGRGLVRPELAVLLSTTKLLLQDAIESSSVDEDEAMVPMLLGAFPDQVSSGFRQQVLGHRLRSELIATKLANRMINRMGLVHPFELAEEEGASLAHVAASFACAQELFGLEAIWDRLDQAKMPEEARLILFDRLALATRIQMADLLRAGAGKQGPAKLIANLKAGIAQLSAKAETLLQKETRQHSSRIREEFAAAGAPAAEAAMVAHLFDLDGAVGLTRLAVDCGIAPLALTGAFTDLGARLGLDWVQARASVMNPSDPWERVLVAGLARDFQQMRLEFLRELSDCNSSCEPEAAIAQWAESRHAAIDQFRSLVARARNSAVVTPSMLAQIAGQARNLLAR